MKYVTIPIHVDELAVSCAMNIKTWNKLPKDIQDIINDMNEWCIDLHDKAILRNVEEFSPKMKSEFGIETIILSPEEQAKFDAALESIRKEFVADLESKGLPGQKLMDRFLELNKKYSDEKYKW